MPPTIDRDSMPQQGGWRDHARDTGVASCVGGLWGDAHIEPESAAYVAERYKAAISNAPEFVHANTLSATCTALGVTAC